MSRVIAVFGGAFDPVHLDHVTIGRLAVEHGYADEVWFVPSPDRWDKKLFASATHRMAMLQLALEGHPQLVASDLEIQMGEFRGTYCFLRQLAEAHPQHEFRLLIGADSYSSIPRWRDPLHFYGTEFNGEQLLREFPLVIFGRKEYPFPDLTQHTAQGFLPFSSLGAPQGFEGVYASSILRTHLARKSSAPEGLSPVVFQYIREHALYRH